MATAKPIIGISMGDPAGISPELTAKVAALDEVRDAARLVVIGDARVLDVGAKVAGIAKEQGGKMAEAVKSQSSPSGSSEAGHTNGTTPDSSRDDYKI